MVDATTPIARPSLLERFTDSLRRAIDSDLFHGFTHSPITVAAFTVTAVFFIGAFAAPFLAPHDTNNVASLNLSDAFLPPMWEDGGRTDYALGTDNQGRDVLSSIMYGMRVSLAVGFASVLLAMVVGTALGLLSGYVGGMLGAFIMRVADIQLTFPAILVALLIDGVATGLLPPDMRESLEIYVLILAIASSQWVNFARTVRGSTMVEKNKEYVLAAKVIGIPPMLIMVRHILPNVMGPTLVIATLSLALAILTEATLSFLGVGVPPTQPSLGTLIRVGNDFLFSGEWWMAIFPGLALVVLVFAVNLLGDWLRDALNPKLQ